MPDILLGNFSLGHLGDALCATPLPRLLRRHRGVRVFVSDQRALRAVFANNPFVAGFVPRAGVPLVSRARGFGHLIQRFEQGFGLPHDPVPQPEIYLSDEETQWARAQRARWPTGRPVCLLATRAISDGARLRRVDWPAVAAALAARFTLVQPVLTRIEHYRDEVDARLAATRWDAETPVPGATVYRDLPLRRYLALFSVIDAFCGGTSGGSHAAAAFDLPSLIVAWGPLLSEARFPVSAPGIPPSIFLYPQHHFVAGEEVSQPAFNTALVETMAQDLYTQSQHRRASPLLAASPLLPDFRPRMQPQSRQAGRRMIAVRT